MISSRRSLGPVMMKMLTWVELLMVQQSCFSLCLQYFVSLYFILFYYFYVLSNELKFSLCVMNLHLFIINEFVC